MNQFFVNHNLILKCIAIFFIYRDFEVTLTKKIIQNNLPILSTELLKREVNQISQSLGDIQHYGGVSPQKDLILTCKVILYKQLDSLQKITETRPPPRPLKSKLLVLGIIILTRVIPLEHGYQSLKKVDSLENMERGIRHSKYKQLFQEVWSKENNEVITVIRFTDKNILLLFFYFICFLR